MSVTVTVNTMKYVTAWQTHTIIRMTSSVMLNLCTEAKGQIVIALFTRLLSSSKLDCDTENMKLTSLLSYYSKNG